MLSLLKLPFKLAILPQKGILYILDLTPSCADSKKEQPRRFAKRDS